MRFNIDNDCKIRQLIEMQKEFDVKSWNKEELVIDIWTHTSCFDITFENENSELKLPSITLKNL